jgi:hypothetical protein
MKTIQSSRNLLMAKKMNPPTRQINNDQAPKHRISKVGARTMAERNIRAR